MPKPPIRRRRGLTTDAPSVDASVSPPEVAPPNSGVQMIEAGAALIKQRATGLSERVVKFEEWLNGLPGKVRATIWSEHEDDPSGTFYRGLCFRRQGKQWGLVHCVSRPDEEPGGEDWSPLSEASLEIKMLAISRFPELLAEIVKQQEVVANEILKAQCDFDSFATAIGLLSLKEGK